MRLAFMYQEWQLHEKNYRFIVKQMSDNHITLGVRFFKKGQKKSPFQGLTLWSLSKKAFYKIT